MNGQPAPEDSLFTPNNKQLASLLAAGAIVFFLALLTCLVFSPAHSAHAAGAQELPSHPDFTSSRYPGVLHGGWTITATAARDTIYILGGPDRSDGKFQDPADPTLPDAQGWAGWSDWPDLSGSYWHSDTFNAELLDPAHEPNHAMWCGTVFDTCDPPNPGYGNNWDEILEWYGEVSPDGATIHLTARLNHDSEPAYDFLYLEMERAEGWDELLAFEDNNRVDGVFVPVEVDITFQAYPADLVGPDQDQVHLRWRFTSDGGWSDEDCLFDSDGAAQIDNITVEVQDTSPPLLLSYDDFEPGSAVNWTPGADTSECSYAQVWPRLHDLDICHENTTPQFAFVDDGNQCGGPGSPGVIWTYGPGGYVVHYGDDFFPLFHSDEVWSPPLAWPEGDHDSAILAFDIYQHSSSIAGQFITWAVRSSSDGGSTWGDWENFNFVYYDEGPEYSRRILDISSLLEPGRTHLQVSLGYMLLGWTWGWDDPADLTPAPYYDNVALKVYASSGPVMITRSINLAQDAFPQHGGVDWEDLGQNSVRFGMAQNISPPIHQRNDPGDSLVIDAVAVRAGSVLDGPPQMHWRLWNNPVFDPYRAASAPNPVPGDTVYTATGTPIADRWSFDLPDSGFLFPGDILHYYFLARDNAGGDMGMALLPADTAGFSQGPGSSPVNSIYPTQFTLRALPTMHSPDTNAQPGILLWYDQGGPEGLNGWSFSLANLGFQAGMEFDLYLTQGASSGVGNGLGGRTTLPQIAGYEVILYSSGNLARYTLGTGDFDGDPSDDVGLLTAWLISGGKNLLATGDHLAFDLSGGDSEGQAFVSDVLGIDFITSDVKPLIDQQTSPVVAPVADDSVFHAADRWHIFGGCPDLNRFDAVLSSGSTQRLAEFTGSEGETGMYPYSAATLHENPTFAAKVISLPYDLTAVRNLISGNGLRLPMAARTHLLDDILTYFEHLGSAPTDVPAAGGLASRTYPNPFNPRVTIAYTVPYRDHLTVRIYDLRGQLVRVLLSETVPAGSGEVLWDGTDARGGATASGVYFAELQHGTQTQIHKLALVR